MTVRLDEVLRDINGRYFNLDTLLCGKKDQISVDPTNMMTWMLINCCLTQHVKTQHVKISGETQEETNQKRDQLLDDAD